MTSNVFTLANPELYEGVENERRELDGLDPSWGNPLVKLGLALPPSRSIAVPAAVFLFDTAEGAGA